MEKKFGRIIQFLHDVIPVGTGLPRKELIPHALRVGAFLEKNGYTDEVVTSALLHDVFEFSDTTEDAVKEKFGDKIVRLIKANSKDDSIADPQEKTNELIQRCVACGEDALIIKTADILDSIEHYTKTQNNEQLEYCKRNVEAIIKYKPDTFTDPIFAKLTNEI